MHLILTHLKKEDEELPQQQQIISKETKREKKSTTTPFPHSIEVFHHCHKSITNPLVNLFVSISLHTNEDYLTLPEREFLFSLSLVFLYPPALIRYFLAHRNIANWVAYFSILHSLTTTFIIIWRLMFLSFETNLLLIRFITRSSSLSSLILRISRAEKETSFRVN